ncbi:MAG: hypothetical protein JSV86_03270 [Gemmatimonadota bacterium]|nr:MAG: hypothetical protein JSV86_03270 [Gemmatimonadota bacterium]
MGLINRQELRTLIEERASLCVSLYLPTHRTGAETQQDPIRLKNLLRQAEDRLRNNGLRRADAEKILGPARRLQVDRSFWQHQSDGLAVFASPETFRSYRLPFRFSELVVVTDRFHVKPLLPLLSGDGRFYILALSQKEVRLLQGTRHSVGEVSLDYVPRSLAEALGGEERERQLQFHTAARGGSAIFHGHGSAGDVSEHKKDLLRYFQQIDRGLQDLVCAERIPLVLAGVDYLLPIYREANTCAQLVEEAIVGNPDGLSADELHDEAWTILEPYFAEAQRRAAAKYLELVGTGKSSRDLDRIIPSAYQGRVDSLFVAVGVQRWGSVGETGGDVVVHEERRPGDQDLLDLAAVQTLVHAGDVYAVSPDQIPDAQSPVAAVYRY